MEDKDGDAHADDGDCKKGDRENGMRKSFARLLSAKWCLIYEQGGQLPCQWDRTSCHFQCYPPAYILLKLDASIQIKSDLPMARLATKVFEAKNVLVDIDLAATIC